MKKLNLSFVAGIAVTLFLGMGFQVISNAVPLEQTDETVVNTYVISNGESGQVEQKVIRYEDTERGVVCYVATNVVARNENSLRTIRNPVRAELSFSMSSPSISCLPLQ